jgi:hypothetical protein
VSVAAALSDLLAALEGSGLRVAVRDGDITPPVVYVRIGTVSDAGAVLAGGTMTGFYLYYIPIRGVDNLTADAESLDVIYRAVTPIAWSEVAATATSLSVKNDSWPCYRLDVSCMAVTAAAVERTNRANHR